MQKKHETFNARVTCPRNCVRRLKTVTGVVGRSNPRIATQQATSVQRDCSGSLTGPSGRAHVSRPCSLSRAPRSSFGDSWRRSESRQPTTLDCFPAPSRAPPQVAPPSMPPPSSRPRAPARPSSASLSAHAHSQVRQDVCYTRV